MTYDIDIDSYIGYPISKDWVRAQLKGFKGKPVSVRINSYGGDVMTALDILQQFRDHGDVTAYVFGMTASAATILAMGAKKVVMSKYALMLIHRCSGWSDAWGQYNAEELAEVIKSLEAQKADLETIDRVICSVYADRTGLKPADVAKTMEEGAWLSADQCAALGLVDEIIEEGEAPAVTDSVRHQFAACGLPVPQSIHSPQSIQSKQSAQSIQQKEQTSTLKNFPKMNTDKFSHLAALIDLAPVTAQADGSATFTDEQLTALEGKLADAKAAADKAAADAAAVAAELEKSVSDLTAEKANLEKQISDLTEQVKNLQSADGAESPEVQPATNDVPTTAFAMFEAVKSFL